MNIVARLAEQVCLTSIGLGVFLGALYYSWRGQSRRWRMLAAVYATQDWPSQHLGKKHMQSLILRGAGAFWTSYTGVTTVAVTTEGIWLRLWPVFSIMHEPLMLPFAEMQVEQTDWYLNSSSFELVLKQVPDLHLIITGDLLDWISQQAPHWNVDRRRFW